MQKLILDTNVIVSSLIQKSFPYLIVDHCLDGKAKICVSSPILKEYFEILARPKFARFHDFKSNADLLLTKLLEEAEFFEPQSIIKRIKDDPDNRLLELAHISKADFIITGNIKDFNFTRFETSQIVSPKEFWEVYKD
jgi:uncharacterized protein